MVFCHFAESTAEQIYDQIPNVDHMSKVLMDSLKEYNEMNAEMDLVLFEDAMKHVARIVRIVLNPAGHALLVGVGGSGKQSLSRLASFICNYGVYQIQISSTYSITDLKEDLKIMYAKAGVKDEGVSFLLTDSQITNERFLIYINDLLASGEVPDLFAPDEVGWCWGVVLRSACALSNARCNLTSSALNVFDALLATPPRSVVLLSRPRVLLIETTPQPAIPSLPTDNPRTDRHYDQRRDFTRQGPRHPARTQTAVGVFHQRDQEGVRVCVCLGGRAGAGGGTRSCSGRGGNGDQPAAFALRAKFPRRRVTSPLPPLPAPRTCT